jgi:hypothetical protein
MGDPDRTPFAALFAAAAAALATPVRAELATTTTLRYQRTAYDEAPLPADVVIQGSRDRYAVDAHQVEIATPLGGEAELALRATHESMSGASPWFVLRDRDGELRQVMSGATIADTRRELVATMRREPAPGEAWTASASISTEDDYRSASLGLGRERPLGAQHTLAYGISASNDVVEPTDAVAMGRVERADKHTLSGVASATFVLDRRTTLQAGVSATFGRGYLDDPYKLAIVGGALVPDARPDTRNQLAWIARWRRAFDRSSLHVDYRYAHDSWSVRAHTLEASWYRKLGAAWWLVPSLRYHSQSEAHFYAPVHDAAASGRDHSSDYRLGTFGAWTARLSLRRTFGPHAFTIGIERYDSDEDAAIGGADQAVPALLEYDRLYAGFELAF